MVSRVMTYQTEISNKIKNIIKESGIYLTKKEFEKLEITHFGLNNFRDQGLVIHTYINTDRCCAKELIMLPYQTCPEHRHPSVGGKLGKEEPFVADTVV